MPANSPRPIASRTPSCAAMSGSMPSPHGAAKVERVLALAGRVRSRTDPKNPYPKNSPAHIRAVLADGGVVEERQPHLRGGAHEPLASADIAEKFILNARHGGWDAARAERTPALLRTLYHRRIDPSSLRQ